MLAQEGSHKMLQDILDLTPVQKFNLTGVKLATISQATAYKGIQERLCPNPRPSTVINLDITRYAVERTTKHLPTDATIWLSIRNRDITRTIRVFLWKVLHNAHKCGNYWLQIPNFEHRSTCLMCGVEDSMTHILTECDAPGQKEIWNLTKDLWLSKHNLWPNVVNIGVITGCCLAKFLNGKGQHKLGAERLYRILMTESAHLIWRIRCEHIIERSNREQWHCIINKRLTLDQAMTNKRYETKAISTQTVLHTWSGTLKNELSLPDNWINYSGVLVGIRPPEQPWWQPAEPP
jgi:ribonuclease HI